jgi:hypothetical protein
MKHKFNWSASTCEAALVLEGEYTDEELIDTQRLLLDNMTRVTETEDNSQYITDKDFVGKFKVLKWTKGIMTVKVNVERRVHVEEKHKVRTANR